MALATEAEIGERSPAIPEDVPAAGERGGIVGSVIRRSGGWEG
jgi:hypothetical protein